MICRLAIRRDRVAPKFALGPLLAIPALVALLDCGAREATRDIALLARFEAIETQAANVPPRVSIWLRGGERVIDPRIRQRLALGTSERSAIVTRPGLEWSAPLPSDEAKLDLALAVLAPPEAGRGTAAIDLVEGDGPSARRTRLAEVAIRASGSWQRDKWSIPASSDPKTRRRLVLSSDGEIPVAWAEPFLERGGGRIGSNDPRPDLILVILDTVRADHLSTYGYPRKTTPNLDALAEKSLVFERAFSASTWTLPSTSSLMTGLYPDQHGVLRLPDTLPESAITVAESLRALGYRTAAFTDGGFVDPRWGLAQGFDRYDSTRGPAWGPKDAKTIATQATKWLRGNRFAPTFLLVHTYEAHQPYLNREGFADEFLPPALRSPTTRLAIKFPARFDEAQLHLAKALYDGEIRRADHYLAGLFAALEKNPRWDSTAVIVTSDHGEEFQEHGNLEHGLGKVFDENIHVPMIVRAPGVRPARIATPVSGVDVAPTLLALAGASNEVLARLPGRSLVETAARAAGRENETTREVLVQGSSSFAELAERRERLDVGTETLIWDRVRRRARRYDRANDPQMRAPADGFEPQALPLVARLQTTLGWLSGPATVRLPDDAAGLAIPQTSAVVPLAVWDGLERKSPPKSGERRDLTPGRPHALVFARRATSGDLAVRIYTQGNDRPAWLRLNATQALAMPLHGPLPRIGDVIRSLLGPGAAGVAKLDREGVEELRSLGYLR